MTAKEKPAPKDVASKSPNDLSLSVRDGVDGVKEGMNQSELMAAVIARSVMSAPTLKLYSACGDGLEVQDLVN